MNTLYIYIYIYIYIYYTWKIYSQTCEVLGKGRSPFSKCKSCNWYNFLTNSFFQSPFEANIMFCLFNKFVLFTNQKPLLQCVRQNSYLDLASYTLDIIWQGAHLLVKLQAGRTIKWNISQAFPEALTSAQTIISLCNYLIAEQLFLRNTSQWLLLPWNMIMISL